MPVGRYLLLDTQTTHRYLIFWKHFCMAAGDLLVSVKLRLWFQHDSAPAQHEEDSGQWLNATHPGRLTGNFRADCTAPSVAGSNSILFYVATPEGSSLPSPSEDNGRRRDKRTGSCDNGLPEYMCFKACSLECRAKRCCLSGSDRRPL